MNPSYATATEGESAERLEWQSELDSAMTDLDSRLRHPRRRASDVGPQPTLPELGQFDVTQELLDEISWRVAEQLRRQAASFVPQGPLSVQAAGMLPNATTAVAPTPVVPSIPEGTAMVIRRAMAALHLAIQAPAIAPATVDALAIGLPRYLIVGRN